MNKQQETQQNKRRTFTLQWHLTEKCNLRCKHCYQNGEYLNNEVPLNTKYKFIDDFVKFCGRINRNPRIAFTGGEPLLIKDEVTSLLNYCNKKYPFLKKSILTNGTLISGKNIEDIKRLNFDYVQISLDGGIEKTHDFIRGGGNFNKSVNALKILKDNGIKTAVMFVFHKKNYKEIPSLIQLCVDKGVDHLGITALVPTGSGKEIRSLMLLPHQTRDLYTNIMSQQIKLIKDKKKLKIEMKRPLWVLIKGSFKKHSNLIGGGCAAGFSGLTLLPNGDIMPCRRLNLVIGNLNNQTFFDIWYSSEVLWDLREREKVGECSICKHNKVCGGCKAVSYAVYKDYLRKDPQCWHNQKEKLIQI